MAYSLPHDVLLRIIDVLSLADAATCSGVCQRWYVVVRQSRHWRRFRVQHNASTMPVEAVRQGLCGAPYLRVLVIREYRHIGEVIDVLCRHGSHLQTLDIGRSKMERSSWCNMASADWPLRQLNVGSSNIDDEALKMIIRRFDCLHTLVINNCKYLCVDSLVTIADVLLMLRHFSLRMLSKDTIFLSALNKLGPKLVSLFIQNVTEMSARFSLRLKCPLDFLMKCVELERLTLSWLSDVNISVNRLPKLTHFTFHCRWGCSVSEEDWVPKLFDGRVSSFRNLCCLEFRRFSSFNKTKLRAILDTCGAGLRYFLLDGATHMEEQDLSTIIRGCPNMKRLAVLYCGATYLGFSAAPLRDISVRMPKLRYLNTRGSVPLDSGILEHLHAVMPNLVVRDKHFWYNIIEFSWDNYCIMDFPTYNPIMTFK